MKTSQLKSIIKETVRQAIREELKDLLVEAVTIASEPSNQEENSFKQSAYNFTPKPAAAKTLDEALEQTKRSMTSEDFRNIVNNGNSINPNTGNISMTSENVGPTPQVGLDLSKLDFVQKAATVYNKAIEKDKNK